MSNEICFRNGCVYLIGKFVNQFSQNGHITIFTKQETKQITKLQVQKFIDNFDVNDVISLGVGKRNQVKFQVILWAKGQKIRRELGFGRKDFHITLSDTDLHDIDKGVRTLEKGIELPTAKRLLDYLKETQELELVEYLLENVDLFKELQIDIYDLAALIYYNHDLCNQSIVCACKLLDLGCQKAGYTRVGDVLYKQRHYNLAAMCFFEVWCLLNDTDSEKITKYTRGRLQKCLEKQGNLWLSLVTLEDYEVFQGELKNYIPVRKMHQVRNVFDLIKNWTVSRTGNVESREKLVYLPSSHTLPRFYTWVVHGLLAGMSVPKSKSDIECLEDIGISSVYTLTDEYRLPSEWFTHSTNYYFPVENYKAPKNFDYVDFFVQNVVAAGHNSRLEGSLSNAALVHCGGGKGRAGLFLACYLVRFGLKYPDLLCNECFSKHSADPNVLLICKNNCALAKPPVMSANEAIDLLRVIRPGSVETVIQEEYVKAYTVDLWKRLEKSAIQEPSSNGDVIGTGKYTKPQVIICCGLPGSGKSYFSKALSEKYKRICQDESLSKEDCKYEFRLSLKANECVMIDRCNPALKDRQEWLELVKDPKSVLCVYFDVPANVCIERASRRLLHPTLTGESKCSRVIQEFSQKMQKPRLEEGFGCILTVDSFKSCNNLLKDYFGIESSADTGDNSVPVDQFHKFPRTMHLMNLGGVSRDDLLLTSRDQARFFNPDSKFTLTCEEKVDGANIGISLTSSFTFQLQNRGKYVNSQTHLQFKGIDKWLSDHQTDLFKLLMRDESMPTRYILFGEWMAAKHSILYTSLDDMFLAFDLYDTVEKKFFSRTRFYEMLQDCKSISIVPRVEFQLPLNEDIVIIMCNGRSRFYDGPLEGIYFRIDAGDWLIERAKVVRSDFLTSEDHWTKGIMVWNKVSFNKN